MPSYNALINHCLRACYVLKLVCCIATPSCPALNSFTKYGWVVNNGEVEIDWGRVDDEDETALMEMKCGCKGGCNSFHVSVAVSHALQGVNA